MLSAGCWLLVSCYWLLAAGCARCWLPAAECWLLSAGCSLLAAFCRHTFIACPYPAACRQQPAASSQQPAVKPDTAITIHFCARIDSSATNVCPFCDHIPILILEMCRHSWNASKILLPRMFDNSRPPRKNARPGTKFHVIRRNWLISDGAASCQNI